MLSSFYFLTLVTYNKPKTSGTLDLEPILGTLGM